MKRKLKITALFVVALAAVFATYMVIRIGPRNVWGMLRYDQRREGDLVAGDAAPDFVLTELDGVTRTGILARPAGQPLVLIFGSYT